MIMPTIHPSSSAAPVVPETPIMAAGARGIFTSEGAGYVVTKLGCWAGAAIAAWLVSHNVLAAGAGQTVADSIATIIGPVLMGLGALALDGWNQHKWTHERTALKISATTAAATVPDTEVKIESKTTTPAKPGA